MTQLQQTYSRTQQILESFGPGSGQKTIYQPSTVSPWDRVQTLRFYGFITSLRMRVDINSIAESELPNLDPTSSRTDRLLAVRDMEWRNPRKQITFYLKTARTPWLPLFDVSLLNRLPYYQVDLLPYFTSNMSFDTANDCAIAAQITNAGYGLLNSSDNVTLYGSVREEITTLPTDAPEISYGQPHAWEVGTDSQILLPANPNRLQATLVNRSLTTDCFLNYGAIATLGQGITLMRGGGSYEINLQNPYRGAVSAIASEPCTVTGLEGV